MYTTTNTAFTPPLVLTNFFFITKYTSVSIYRVKVFVRKTTKTLDIIGYIISYCSNFFFFSETNVRLLTIKGLFFIWPETTKPSPTTECQDVPE